MEVTLEQARVILIARIMDGVKHMSPADYAVHHALATEVINTCSFGKMQRLWPHHMHDLELVED